MPNFIASLSSLFLLTSLVSAGPYDAAPLRGALTEEPHFQTSQAREGHRFAQAAINEYRLYDFYARQAAYHLGKKEISPLLLPYPGLEGGRRGHWGGTNEKLSSVVLKRTEEPRYVRLVGRGAQANKYVVISHGDNQSLCLFGNATSSMSKVVINAALVTPEHPFSHQVDRFGFDLSVTGQDYLVGRGAEWYSNNRQALEVLDDGHHLSQDSVVFRRIVAGSPMLDMARVSHTGNIPVYQRVIEWRDESPTAAFTLPVEATLIKQGKVEIRKENHTWIATVTGGERKLTHLVRCSQGVDEISLSVANGRIWVQFPVLKKGTCIRMDSWISATNDTAPQLSKPKEAELSSLIRQAPRYFKKEVTVTGKLNADPAARGTAYEIDDIPVPADNPYGMPMTLSGLTFSEGGDAFLCTLVGDVWKITGLQGDLMSVNWQRFASGLNSPLGLEMVNGVLHVITQHQILQLHDTNKNGEADLVRPLTKVKFPVGRVHNLCRDDRGNFYFSHVSGIHRVSPDGAKMEIISSPSRNPLGLAVRPDGLALSDSSEGNNSNGTCSIFESRHSENTQTKSKLRRILYLPRGVDNSPGSRVFMSSQRFGPLGSSLLGLSYGTGRLYQILRDPNGGTPQAALHLLPGEFSSGTCRLAVNPKDGQLYVAGLDGWGDFAVTEGCFHRVRFTGKKTILPTSWKAYSNGLSIRFNHPIDPASIAPERLFIQQWNYIDSLHTYGSAEYSVRQPDQLGHDRVLVKSIYFSPDGKEMFLNIPDILPAMCTQIYGKFKSRSGEDFALDLYATVNKLPEASVRGVAAKNNTRVLSVPFKKNNGNTYVEITRFYDKRAGRDVVKRPMGPVVSYTKKDLSYAWVRQNILQSNACITCHQTGNQHDFSSYEKLLKLIDLKHPEKSHLLGMIETGSMPPYPLPLVAPEMRKALRQWIEMGAPK